MKKLFAPNGKFYSAEETLRLIIDKYKSDADEIGADFLRRTNHEPIREVRVYLLPYEKLLGGTDVVIVHCGDHLFPNIDMPQYRLLAAFNLKKLLREDQHLEDYLATIASIDYTLDIAP